MPSEKWTCFYRSGGMAFWTPSSTTSHWAHTFRMSNHRTFSNLTIFWQRYWIKILVLTFQSIFIIPDQFRSDIGRSSWTSEVFLGQWCLLVGDWLAEVYQTDTDNDRLGDREEVKTWFLLLLSILLKKPGETHGGGGHLTLTSETHRHTCRP